MRQKIISFFIFIYCISVAQEDTLKTFSELIKLRSVSGNERTTAQFLFKKCNEVGFVTQMFCDKDSFMNFTASLYPLSLGKPNIVFLCHVDVVPALDSMNWKYHPFSGAIVNDTLWGRGCLDMKAIGLMEYYALQSFLPESKANNLPYNVTILFVSDEEIGGVHGAKFITENYLKLLNPKVVIGEGGGGFKYFLPSKPEQLVFTISLAEKKSLWLKLSVKHSTGGHGAMRSTETANSILLKAIDRIEDKKPIIIFDRTTKRMFRELGKLNGGLTGFVLKHINSFLLRPFRRKILNSEPLLLNEVICSTQFTNIHNAPSPPNVIPTEAEAFFDCRLLPGISEEKFIRRVKLKMLSPKVNIEIIDQSPTAFASPDDETFETIEKAIVKAYPIAKTIPVLFPATTDNSYFRALGVPCYGLLPLELSQGLIKNVHGANECIPVPTIFKGIEAYKILMRDLIIQK